MSHIEATPLSLPATSGIVVGSGPGEYLGFSVRESSGVAAATVILYDSNTNSGPILEEITLNANESDDDHYDRPGRYVGTGIYAQITGSVQGSVFQ